jgi:HNH endonuclease
MDKYLSCVKCGARFSPGKMANNAKYCEDCRSPYDAADWQRVRKIVLERDGYICKWCGRPGNVVDHLIPVSKGGPSDDPDLLVTSCRPCNSSRNARGGGASGVANGRKVSRTRSAPATTAPVVRTHIPPQPEPDRPAGFWSFNISSWKWEEHSQNWQAGCADGDDKNLDKAQRIIDGITDGD